MQIATTSLEYVLVPVVVRESGAVVDPTALPVRMAFVADGPPAEVDWKTADWETAPGPPVVYSARCLVGPGGTVALPAGLYEVWVEITDNPEKPVRPSGRLEVR